MTITLEGTGCFVDEYYDTEKEDGSKAKTYVLVRNGERIEFDIRTIQFENESLCVILKWEDDYKKKNKKRIDL